MDTGDGKELTDKDEKEKELKVKMIRARKTGSTHWSGGGTSGRKEGRRDGVYWNSGGQVRLTGSGQDHLKSERIGIMINGGIQGVAEESRRRKDLEGWRNIGDDQEKSSRVMVEGHPSHRLPHRL